MIREDFIVEAYEILQLLCEMVVERLGLIASEKTCPLDMNESLSTLIYATDRTEIPELKKVREQLTKKYGREFASRARQGENVNSRVEHKLSVQPPSKFLVIQYLKEIATTYKVDWAPDESTAIAEQEMLRTGTGALAYPQAAPTGYSVQVRPRRTSFPPCLSSSFFLSPLYMRYLHTTTLVSPLRSSPPLPCTYYIYHLSHTHPLHCFHPHAFFSMHITLPITLPTVTSSLAPRTTIADRGTPATAGWRRAEHADGYGWPGRGRRGCRGWRRCDGTAGIPATGRRVRHAPATDAAADAVRAATAAAPVSAAAAAPISAAAAAAAAAVSATPAASVSAAAAAPISATAAAAAACNVHSDAPDHATWCRHATRGTDWASHSKQCTAAR